MPLNNVKSGHCKPLQPPLACQLPRPFSALIIFLNKPLARNLYTASHSALLSLPFSWTTKTSTLSYVLIYDQCSLPGRANRAGKEWKEHKSRAHWRLTLLWSGGAGVEKGAYFKPNKRLNDFNKMTFLIDTLILVVLVATSLKQIKQLDRGKQEEFTSWYHYTVLY